MIIDRIQIAGADAYFQQGGSFNLAGAGPVLLRTSALKPGQQREISGLRLLIQAENLMPLFQRQSSPLLRISVRKEMFPCLFADPYGHRVHIIAGFDDFNRGKFENSQPMEVEGIPTIVSIGTGRCKWTSPIFPMPYPLGFEAVAWDLASSRLTPASAFRQWLKVRYWTSGQSTDSAGQELPIVTGGDADVRRAVFPLDLGGVSSYQVEFEAEVLDDSYIYERHTPVLGESIGRPLLRAVNLLEAVPSAFEFYSLQELLAASLGHHLFEYEEGTLRSMTAVLNFSAILVNSPNEDPATNQFEFVQFEADGDQFEVLEARLEGSDLLRPPRDT
jgi:hypothetical protein